MKFEKKYFIENYYGKQINYLTPLQEVSERAKDGSKKWEFECICGEHIFETPYRVISGHKKSCGCMRYKNMRSGPREHGNPSRINPDSYVGLKNNMLTVVGYTDPKDKGRIKLKCLCDCGNTAYVYPYQFKSGAVQSCGCARDGHKFESENYKKHGLSRTSFYHTWQHMKNRCYNKNADNYDRYGGRGIYVCDEWLKSAESFIKWAMETKPKEGKYTIDRIDNDGPYAPWNCRWATDFEQSRNKRNSLIIEYNGVKKCLIDWSKEFNINDETLRCRLNHGWPIERALTEPVNKKFRHKKDCE